MNIILWIIIGGLAGWAAEQVMKSNQTLVMNVVFGIAGAVILNGLLALVGIALGGIIGQLIVAFLGACLLIAVVRAFRRAT